MSDKYRPSCGDEGIWFENKFCCTCKKDAGFRDWVPDDNGCRILADSMAYSIDDPKYPKEWIRDEKGIPTCTAFEDVRGILTEKDGE